MHAWSVGDHLTHRFNSELGTGCVTAIEGRVLLGLFPQGGATLRFAAASDALVPETERSRRRDRTLLERLAAGEIDETEDFLTRLDSQHLQAATGSRRRRATGLRGRLLRRLARPVRQRLPASGILFERDRVRR